MKLLFASTLLSTIAVFFASASVASADFIITFDPTDLIVNPTGGMVTQSVDMLITHNGPGLNTFSDYDLRISPASPAIVLMGGNITSSKFTFDTFHATLGAGPFSVTGINSANLSVSSGTNDLLARLTFAIDTSVLTSGTVALSPSVTFASRGGILGSSILGEVSVVPASFSITAVPEPSSIALLLVASTALPFLRKRILKRPACC